MNLRTGEALTCQTKGAKGENKGKETYRGRNESMLRNSERCATPHSEAFGSWEEEEEKMKKGSECHHRQPPFHSHLPRACACRIVAHTLNIEEPEQRHFLRLASRLARNVHTFSQQRIRFTPQKGKAREKATHPTAYCTCFRFAVTLAEMSSHCQKIYSGGSCTLSSSCRRSRRVEVTYAAQHTPYPTIL
ncbi:hypothetical protein PHSY_006339 [Pseudozyma hubeiensis SY62]|uniref:Uncharacterized protein n=1 Tax=Pseudozyma hubeiensis (strain SY62) TaxID=1305764 RepID=R9PKW6_PSEHS|nr:hypothetical protein PHSY_006339 [Pseudozyma hubeiensis SY62]GAC98745.1 hypothetical protein PHSY_006339 [Pseudozyma hubeiensis SY62]